VAGELASAAVPAAAPPLSATQRFQATLPLFALGFLLLLGAALAAAAHAKLFSPAYPLWILLGLNGVVATAAGAASYFVREPGSPFDDPSIVPVPRATWERMLRQRGGAPAPSPSWEEPEEARPAPPPAAPELRAPSPPPPPPVRPAPAAVRAVYRPPDPTAVRQEVALLELQSLAESALATAENLGAPELATLLDSSRDDLARLSVALGVRGPAGEPARARLDRLLQDVAASETLPVGPKLSEELRELGARLDELAPTSPGPAPPSLAPGPATLDPEDEFERLLQELERSQPGAARRRPPPGPGS
jgi:hypothetical protein